MQSSAAFLCVEICDMERMENKLKLSVCEAIGKKWKNDRWSKGERTSQNECVKWKSLKCVLYVIVTV